MNLTHVLQPYVCCLGNPVAGNPTQFVMYRAARACGVDWRFFTSQVEVEQFEVAFRGVQALGLSGVALFDPFQTKALSLMDTLTESALCLGRVNVARSDGNSWLGDNTLGTAIMSCFAPDAQGSQVASSSEVAKGEGERQSAILVIGDAKIANAMRLASPEQAKQIFLVAGLDHHRSNAEESAEMLQPDFKVDCDFPSLDEFGQSGLEIASLVVSSIQNAATLRHTAGLSWSDSVRCLVLSPASEKQLRMWRDSWKIKTIDYVEAVELMAHQAAADFQFWTGVAPAFDLIRDSLEEYLQW